MNDKSSPVAADVVAPPISKMVDTRLPLHWLLTISGTLAFCLIGMWFSLQQIKADMLELKAATVIAVAATGELALVKFRLSTVENDINQLKRK